MRLFEIKRSIIGLVAAVSMACGSQDDDPAAAHAAAQHTLDAFRDVRPDEQLGVAASQLREVEIQARSMQRVTLVNVLDVDQSTDAVLSSESLHVRQFNVVRKEAAQLVATIFVQGVGKTWSGSGFQGATDAQKIALEIASKPENVRDERAFLLHVPSVRTDFLITFNGRQPTYHALEDVPRLGIKARDEGPYSELALRLFDSQSKLVLAESGLASLHARLLAKRRELGLMVPRE